MLQTRFGDKASLRLKKSLCGIFVAPKLWYEHLLRGLKELGFQHSPYNKCFLYRDDMLLVTFVDDCGLAVKSLENVDWSINELRKRGYELHLEGDFTAFLGVTMDPQPDGTIHMHQSGLIKKIIAAAGMEDANPNWTPAPMAAWDQIPRDPFTITNRGNTRALLVCLSTSVPTPTRIYRSVLVKPPSTPRNQNKATLATSNERPTRECTSSLQVDSIYSTMSTLTSLVCSDTSRIHEILTVPDPAVDT
jgi:hypothetical protein